MRIAEIVWSAEGRAAALEAVRAGAPAMPGLDPLIAESLGVDDGAHDNGTNHAGRLAGDLMRGLGFDKGPERPPPPHCVARTAATWLPRRPLAGA